MPNSKGLNSGWLLFWLGLSLCLSILTLVKISALSFVPIAVFIYCVYYVISDHLIRKGRKYIEETYGKK